MFLSFLSWNHISDLEGNKKERDYWQLFPCLTITSYEKIASRKYLCPYSRGQLGDANPIKYLHFLFFFPFFYSSFLFISFLLVFFFSCFLWLEDKNIVFFFIHFCSFSAWPYRTSFIGTCVFPPSSKLSFLLFSFGCQSSCGCMRNLSFNLFFFYTLYCFLLNFKAFILHLYFFGK